MAERRSCPAASLIWEWGNHDFRTTEPVEFVRGEGMRLWDDEGKEYLDFLSGIGVISLGHCHPALVEALDRQTAKLIHVSNYYYIEGRGELAKKLSDLLNARSEEADPEPWQTFFANSGAEANECAIKLARLYARRQQEAVGSTARPQVIIVLERSFHGRTQATLSATAQQVKQEAFQPLPDEKLFVATPSNDVEALEKLFAARGAEVAGMLLEPVQGECGVYPCSDDFLKAARRLCTEHGALLMVDEVQCGMYRCGTYPFAFQHAGIMPDVVTMAKGIAGGVPMGACSAPAHVAAVFEETGAYLREKLASLPQVVEVRGKGLMVAVDLADGLDANAIVLAALEAGLVLNATGPHTLRFLPPLVCAREDVDALIERLAALL